MSKDRVIWCDRGWQPVSYGFCPSEKAWKREMKRMGMDEPYPQTNGRTTFFQKSGGISHCAIVTLNPDEGTTDVEIAGLLTHEGVHVWQEILEVIGEEKPGREMEAYAVQAIVQELLTAYKQTRGAQCSA